VRLYVPGRYGLGYRVVEDNTNVLYIANEHFVSGGDTGVDPFDADLAVDWGTNIGPDNAIMSDRDKVLQSFATFAERVTK
jgi:dTDP-4-dehydrorhamnose 3,5-epimerase-like enzyme